MAKPAPAMRRLHCILSKTPHIVITSVFMYGLLTLLTINYAPSVQYVHVDINFDSPDPESVITDTELNWPRLAYVQFATTPAEVCKAVMLFSQLVETSSPALRVLIYPRSWHHLGRNEYEAEDDHNRSSNPQLSAKEIPKETPFSSVRRLLRGAAEEFSVILQPTEFSSELDTSLTALLEPPLCKYLAFNLTQYERIILLDTDSILARPLDDLFLLPPTPVSAPYVYWHDTSSWALSSKLLVIQPSAASFETVLKTARKFKAKKTAALKEAQILNHFKDSLVLLPQQQYHLLSSEFRQKSHAEFLDGKGQWRAEDVRKEARFIPLWDPPLKAPWHMKGNEDFQNYMPPCVPPLVGSPRMNRYRPKVNPCPDRHVWAKLYSDFMNRRRIVCGEDFV